MAKIKALVIDDDDCFQEIASENLKTIGIKTTRAYNGLDGIKKFRSNKYDFVIVDIKMPIMNGLDTTLKLREIERSSKRGYTPIIVMTSDCKDIRSCIINGADKYIRKPFYLKDIVAALSNINSKIK
jgi:CheY-like chemotaxis protein